MAWVLSFDGVNDYAVADFVEPLTQTFDLLPHNKGVSLPICREAGGSFLPGIPVVYLGEVELNQ